MQAETCQSFNGLVAIAEQETFTNSHLFTLAFDTFTTDNFLTYVVKLLKYKIGLTDASVAFFSSFFCTKLYRKGHKDPALRKKYSY
jgi:Ulp1 family protease